MNIAVSFFYLFLVPLYLIIPAVILYFVVKLAVKNAIKELKEDKTI